MPDVGLSSFQNIDIQNLFTLLKLTHFCDAYFKYKNSDKTFETL